MTVLLHHVVTVTAPYLNLIVTVLGPYCNRTVLHRIFPYNVRHILGRQPLAFRRLLHAALTAVWHLYHKYRLLITFLSCAPPVVLPLTPLLVQVWGLASLPYPLPSWAQPVLLVLSMAQTSPHKPL